MKPIDEFDETCQAHDAMYALGGDLADADLRFARENIGRGVLRTSAAIAVGAQGLLRRGIKFMATRNHTRPPKRHLRRKNPLPKNLGGLLLPRGDIRVAPNNETIPNTPVIKITQKMSPAKANKQNLRKEISAPKNNAQKSSGATSRGVPAAIGTSFRVSKPIVERSNNSARVTGRDFVSTVPVAATSVFGISTTALLSPAFFSSAYLGNLCRSHEKYRWERLRIHYVPACSTATTGSIVLASSHSVTQPGLSGEASNFLPRAMTQGNAAMSPLWEHSYIDIDCSDRSWRLVDPTTSTDLDDNIHEEVQVYFSSGTALTAGFLVADYICSFMDPVYQPHSTSIPIITGPGTICTFTDASAVNAAGDDWALSSLSGLNLSSLENGTILRGVFDLVSSAAPVPATFNNMLNALTFSHNTLTTFTNNTLSVPIVGGLTVYMVVDSTLVKVYTTIESARNGVGSGQLMFRTGTTAAGTYRFITTLVGLSTASMPVVQ